MTPRFFGFGSLVNCDTHSYPNPRPAALTGWRRIWMPIDRDVVALSIHPAPKDTIKGLTADVPNADWAALDAREAGYNRQIIALPEEASETWAYAVPGPRQAILPQHHITQSYLDAVLLGFLEHYGEAGVIEFFETTDGWDIPVRDDRAAPIYPRHQPTTPDQRAFFDSTRRANT